MFCLGPPRTQDGCPRAVPTDCGVCACSRGGGLPLLARSHAERLRALHVHRRARRPHVLQLRGADDAQGQEACGRLAVPQRLHRHCVGLVQADGGWRGCAERGCAARGCAEGHQHDEGYRGQEEAGETGCRGIPGRCGYALRVHGALRPHVEEHRASELLAVCPAAARRGTIGTTAAGAGSS